MLMVILVVRVFKGKSVATIVIKPEEFDMVMSSGRVEVDEETDNEPNDT